MLIKGQKVKIIANKVYFKVGQIVEIHTPDKYGAWLAGYDNSGKFRDWYYDYSEFEIVDTIVESVIEKFRQRSDVGIKKYNTTLDRTDLEIDDWLQHIQEEMMDAVLYLEKIKKTIDELRIRD
jgi:hypothetical protein